MQILTLWRERPIVAGSVGGFRTGDTIKNPKIIYSKQFLYRQKNIQYPPVH
jgi:hypothetical protein